MFTHFRYRCPRCGTNSPRRHTRAGARQEGALHRRRVHGRHHPDGEHIQRASWGRFTRSEALATIAIAVLIVIAVLRNLS